MNEWVKELSTKIKDKIVMKPYLYGFWIAILLILFPALIFIAYYIGDHGYALVFTTLTMGDALGFYGSILSFLGTIALGALALWQNYKLSRTNQNLVMLQLEEYIPYLIIESGEEVNHIEPNRNPDTTQSVLSGSKGFVNFNTIEDQLLYEAEQNRLMQLCQITDIKELTPEKVAKVEEAQIELKRLAKSLKSTTIEHYVDTFWILKKDSEQLYDHFSNTKDLQRMSLKFIFKNAGQAKIKRIIIDKIVFECCMQKWTFNPDSQHNFISQLITKDEVLIFYINLFWRNSDTEIYKILKLYDMYNISFELTLISAGNNKQKEKITSNWYFGKLNESCFELL